MNKKVLPNLPNIPITKQSKWSFISRLFKRSPKIPKPSSRKSKSKESKNDNSNLSNIGLMRPQDFSSFLQNNPVSPSNLAKTKRNDNAFSPESLSNRSREIQNPLSKIFENGTLSTPDKKFLKKFTGTIETEELTQTNQLKKNFENSNDDLRRPKKPLDSTRNKAGGLKYRNKLEKFQKNLERKFSFNYREKAIGELVFNLDFFRDILKFLSLESLLNFWFISKKFHSNDYQYMGLIRKQMVYLVSKGLKRNSYAEKDEQYIFWNYFIHFSMFGKAAYKQKYNSLVENDCKFEREISMDLDRTFPDLDFFKSKHNKRNLQNILRAISNSYPDIGYTQGMNFWVGVLILNGLKENEVYWLLRFFLTKMDLKSMVSPGFPRMCILNYQLEIYLKFQMKDVIDKLNSVGLELSYFTTQWFITLFAYDLPMKTLLAIWNLFLLKGFKIFIKIAMGLISLIKKEILNCEEDYLCEFLKNFIKENFEKKIFTNEIIFKEANSFKVTNRLLRGLEMLHNNSEDPPHEILLQKNPISFKYEWNITVPSKWKNGPKYTKRQSIKLLDEYIVNYMNEKNNKDIINYNTRKAKQGVGKIKKEKESEFFKPKGTLEININEILTSQQVLINTFNTAKYANTQPFVFNPTFLKESFLKNTPNNNKINDFIIPIECKGDDGEIPEIEPILFEKNKQKFSTITHSSGKLLPKPKSISSHFKREIKDIGSPLISDEHDVENINGAKKNRMLISKNTNFINSIQELIINKQVNKYKLDIKLKRIKGQKIHWYLNSFKDHRTKNIG